MRVRAIRPQRAICLNSKDRSLEANIRKSYEQISVGAHCSSPNKLVSSRPALPIMNFEAHIHRFSYGSGVFAGSILAALHPIKSGPNRLRNVEEGELFA
jgi:hypothetical protein